MDNPIFSQSVNDTLFLVFPDSLDLKRDHKYVGSVNATANNQKIYGNSWFKIFSYKKEKEFIVQENEIKKSFLNSQSIPLLSFYDSNKAYLDEFECLISLLNQYPNE